MRGEQYTYDEIKADFLDCYYFYCQHKISNTRKWADDEHEHGYAYDQFVNSKGRCTCFDTPIEKLMFEVIAYVLSGKRNDVTEKHHREMIDDLIKRKGPELIKAIEGLPKEEHFNFISDMKLLKIDFPSVTDK